MNKLYIKIVVALLISLNAFFFCEAQDKKVILKDIFLKESLTEIVFGNSRLALHINRQDGNWTQLMADGSSLIAQTQQPGIDAIVDDKNVLENTKGRYKKHSYSIAPDKTQTILAVTVVTEDGEFALVCYYSLFPDQPVMERSAKLIRLTNGTAKLAERKLQSFVFRIPGIDLGNTRDCVFDAPGPFFTHTFTAPETPVDSLKNKTIGFHSAPDAGFGLLAISNKFLKRTLASWMSTKGEVNYGSDIKGDGYRLSFSHTDHRAAYLPVSASVTSDIQHLELSQNLPESLTHYRQMTEQTMPLEASTPAWVKEAVILEVYPDYFKGGFKELAEKLPYYKTIGFNTLYLMPHWKGGYSPIDLYQVEPKYGTEQDLQNVVAQAHRLGMRVLFDMVIHGFHKTSPVVSQHPEFFCRDSNGKIVLHRTWKSVTPDWANPAYQNYMKNLVRHDLKTYNIDGYRVDAASYKGPDWNPKLTHPAYASGTYAPQLMKVMLATLRETKPEAVLLSEVFGPVFHSVSNFSHDNQTEAIQFILEKMEKGDYTIRQYKAYLANVFTVLPKGANRVIFARNHDTSWFYHFKGYTPAFLNLDAIHVLFAIPEIFAGDPKHLYNPDEKPEVFAFYKKLFELKRQFPEFTTGEVWLNEVTCANPNVWVGIRKSNEMASLVVISLSEIAENVTIHLPDTLDLSDSTFSFKDPLSDEITEGASSQHSVQLSLKPYQIGYTRIKCNGK